MALIVPVEYLHERIHELENQLSHMRGMYDELQDQFLALRRESKRAEQVIRDAERDRIIDLIKNDGYPD